jgi:predicted transcriptional regulator of viral defense system
LESTVCHQIFSGSWLAKVGQNVIGRGLYQLPNAIPGGENCSLVEVSKAVPSCIICLLSALRSHELGTQEPPSVWIAIDRKARKPRNRTVKLEVDRFSGNARIVGVENHVLDGFSVRITNPGRTVADCFKYRNKIGLDVALEALRECLVDKKATIDQLWNYAGICRVQRIMRPYLEALTA